MTRFARAGRSYHYLRVAKSDRLVGVACTDAAARKMVAGMRAGK